MQHEVQVSILKELMRQLDEKVNADAGVMFKNPTSVYTCPDLARREWQTFFQEHPQLVGLSGDLPRPGSFVTLDDFGVPVLATRDPEGRFRAFLNACRHRGVRVATAARGDQERFVCSFHNWVYASTGALVGIPQAKHFGTFDKACRGLIELPAVERDGLLWVHPRADGTIDTDGLLGGLAPEIASWSLHGMTYLGESVIAKRLNWKLANDTFGETYHFQKLHKKTLGNIFHGDVLAYEEFERNHRFVFAAKSIDFMRGQPEREWQLLDGAGVLYFLFPNIQLSLGPGSASLIKIYPDPHDPNRSTTRVAHYFTPEAIAAAAAPTDGAVRVTAENTYDAATMQPGNVLSLSALTEVFDSTIEQEDYLMGETTQRAAENGQLDHLIFGRNEPALHHYHAAYRAALGLEPLERFDG